MIVVSDSSPLIILSRAQQLDLVREFYGQVTISPEVRTEITVMGAGLPGAEEVREASWIGIQQNPSEPSESVKVACSSLGQGERSAIYLALALGADLILIDEQRARRAAQAVGLTVARLHRTSRTRSPAQQGWRPQVDLYEFAPAGYTIRYRTSTAAPVS